MDKINGHMALLLLLLTATWVWSLVAVAGWRLRRRVRLGLPGPPTSDPVVRLAVRGTALLLLGVIVSMVASSS
ncbi:MAG: hypothetical protein K9K66_15125 [Desulfarculaceae bacterium]|nr:hypothetical protein [Desulfarculaceae bacterium]MCF8074254.1 hypothetical protein [Desulfarculaceae bacterium]MCF8102987.1 hypothetical protein [Desulfarculaceae bacterium]MCF8117118.1 hypothetical protein [Desulfarculaceae bacterium]